MLLKVMPMVFLLMDPALVLAVKPVLKAEI